MIGGDICCGCDGKKEGSLKSEIEKKRGEW